MVTTVPNEDIAVAVSLVWDTPPSESHLAHTLVFFWRLCKCHPFGEDFTDHLI